MPWISTVWLYKVRQINLQFIVTSHIKLQEFSNNFIVIINHMILCSSLVNTVNITAIFLGP